MESSQDIKERLNQILMECREIKAHIIDIWRKGQRDERRVIDRRGILPRLERRVIRIEKPIKEVLKVIVRKKIK